MKLHELSQVELRLLEDLALADVDVLQGVDSVAGLLDLTANLLRDELGNEVLEVTGGSLTSHNVDHLAADVADLGGLSERGLAHLVETSLGESNHEDADLNTVGGTAVNMGLDKRQVLTNKRLGLVCGHVHSVEGSQAVAALNILALKLDLTEGVLLVLVEITEVDLIDATLLMEEGEDGERVKRVEASHHRQRKELRASI